MLVFLGWDLQQATLHIQAPGGGEQEEECDPLLLGDPATGV